MDLHSTFLEVLHHGSRAFNQAEVEKALSIATLKSDKTAQFYSHVLLGEILTRQGRIAEAELHYIDALELADAASPVAIYRDICLHGRGHCTIARGELGQALSYLREGLVASRAAEHKHVIARILLTLSFVYASAGSIEKAVDYCRQGCSLSRQEHFHVLLVRGLLTLSELLLREGEFEEAQSTAEDAINVSRSITDVVVQARAKLRLATILLERSQLEQAESILLTLESILSTMTSSSLWGTYRLTRAKLYSLFNRTNEAFAECQAAIMVFEQMNAPRLLINTLVLSAEFKLRAGNASDAILELQRASTIANDHTDEAAQCEIYQLLAEGFAAIENYQDAHASTSRAREIEKSLLKREAQRHILLLRVENEVLQQQRDLEIYRAKSAHLERELANSVMRLGDQSSLLLSFCDELRSILRSENDAFVALRKIKEKIKSLPAEQLDWPKFEGEFASIHPTFKIRLKEAFPDLTKQEVRMCMLARLGLTTEDMAKLLSLSSRTVDGHRNSLRKKLGLTPQQNLSEFLQGSF